MKKSTTLLLILATWSALMIIDTGKRAYKDVYKTPKDVQAQVDKLIKNADRALNTTR